MKISFDLDDTIIPGTKTFETERQTLLHQFLGLERIRKGTIELFAALRRDKHEIGIYTTSYRSEFNIRLTFLLNGFRVDFAINQQTHLDRLKYMQIKPSKYPNEFGIDIHVDDSKGVEMEGEKYNFRTIIIDENEPNWSNKILEKIKSYSH